MSAVRQATTPKRHKERNGGREMRAQHERATGWQKTGERSQTLEGPPHAGACRH